MELVNLLDEYKDRFGTCFPTMNFMGDEDGMIKALKKCIELGYEYVENDIPMEAVI